jgi:hypothetical protein
MNFASIALKIPQILLPKNSTNMQHWSVIACDQYTSDLDYWQILQQQIGNDISTLNLIFPEVYLNDTDNETRIDDINLHMKQYLNDGSLVDQGKGFILIERKTNQTQSRKGLMIALDLEQYDFHKGAKSLIRATEGTIIERLPPRIKVRQNAPIELPHIMVLIDDPQQTVIEPLFNSELKKLYDFELIANGGHITGYKIDQPALITQIVQKLEKLADPESFRTKYHVEDEVMLYAMGDGNHSFATAKAIWEQLKERADNSAEIMHHPARYALVELVNLHDPGLQFEAIHRVLFNVEPKLLLGEMETFFAQRNTPFLFAECTTLQDAELEARQNENQHNFPAIIAGRYGVCCVTAPEYNLAVATLQGFLDHYISKYPATTIDYIHGEETVTELGKQHHCAGFYLPSFSKHSLFKTVIVDGALPRKTFSMGEADEKRFYLESRRIK